MGLGGVAIAILPSIICLKLTFSDGLGGLRKKSLEEILFKMLPRQEII